VIISITVNLRRPDPSFLLHQPDPSLGFSGSSYKQGKGAAEISSTPTKTPRNNTLKQNNKLLPVHNCSQTKMRKTGEVVQHTALQIPFPSGHHIRAALRGPSNKTNFFKHYHSSQQNP